MMITMSEGGREIDSETREIKERARSVQAGVRACAGSSRATPVGVEEKERKRGRRRRGLSLLVATSSSCNSIVFDPDASKTPFRYLEPKSARSSPRRLLVES